MAKNMEHFMEHLSKTLDPSALHDDHALIGGKMLMFNVNFTPEGEDLMEPFFGFPFIKKDPTLLGDLNIALSVLSYLIEHGVPEDITRFYYNNGERMLAQLKEAVVHMQAIVAERGLSEDAVEKFLASEQIDIDRLDTLYSNWQPEV